MMLNIEHLSVVFRDREQPFTAVEDFSLQMDRGEIVGIVGESGSGKSMTAHAIMGLIKRSAVTVSGKAEFDGENLLAMSREKLRGYQGEELSIIFQEPMTSLNPVYTVGWQISEMIRSHEKISKKAAKEKAVEMLRLVNIPAPEKRVNEYPHELSGGMRQRVMIAMALSCEPELLIADEPTTALDVTIQAQILDLMRSLKEKTNTSIMMITHDLGVVAEMSDNVLVMYAGMVMEYSDVKSLFAQPLHPYTQGLMKALPRMEEQQESLYVIKGAVPSLYDLPQGCRFWPRCPYATERCKKEMPPLYPQGARQVRCFRYDTAGEGEKDHV